MIELKNLKKEYVLSKNNKVLALQNINLTIDEGEFVAIVGKSGSGKSTLLNVISCLDKEFSGEYFFEGENIRKKRKNELAKIRNRSFGFIFQNFNLLQKLTAYENIEIPLIYKKVPRRKRKELIEKYAEKLQIKDRLQHKPNELSGGQQQRVSIGRAMINNPAIILADEPTGNLDSKSSEEIVELLKMTNKKYKQTIIMITHNLEIANEADRVLTIEDGRIVS